MEFNPRTATGIPTEPVGSIPRPLKLQQAYAAYDAKKISKNSARGGTGRRSGRHDKAL